MAKFWMIYTPNGQPPKCVHESYKAAVDEAQRLASKHHGCKFYVLESVGVAEIKKNSYKNIEKDLKPPVHGRFNCNGDYIIPKEWFKDNNSNDSGLEDNLANAAGFKRGGIFNEKK